MLPVRTRCTTLEDDLPQDPLPDQIFELPDSQVGGTSYVLHVLKKGAHIGTAEQLELIPNVSGKGMLSRAWALKPWKKGDVIEVLFVRYDYKSLIFREYFGWMGHECYDQHVVEEQHRWRIISLLKVGPQQPDLHFYEKICMEKIRENTK